MAWARASHSVLEAPKQRQPHLGLAGTKELTFSTPAWLGISLRLWLGQMAPLWGFASPALSPWGGAFAVLAPLGPSPLYPDTVRVASRCPRVLWLAAVLSKACPLTLSRSWCWIGPLSCGAEQSPQMGRTPATMPRGRCRKPG